MPYGNVQRVCMSTPAFPLQNTTPAKVVRIGMPTLMGFNCSIIYFLDC